MRIFFTGGSGKAGRHVAPYLAEQGHQVTNADLVPLGHPAIADMAVDLTDPGATYSALARPVTPGAPRYDAVVHFAAQPLTATAPDSRSYSADVTSTYNVIEAATKLDVRKIVFASAEGVYNVRFAESSDPEYVPVDEDHPRVGEDAFANAKLADETIACMFAMRTGADIYGLRLGEVFPPQEAVDLPDAAELGESRELFTYLDVRDLAGLVQRCLLTDGLGYQMFNAASGNESFICIAKARELLGYEPVHARFDNARGPDPEPR